MRPFALVCTLAGVLFALAPAATGQGTPYDVLYTESSAHSSFNAEVMRGMSIARDSMGVPEELFAIHSYESQVVIYDLPATSGVPNEPKARWQTITDPVAIVATTSYVYVLGQGSHALAKHLRSDGRIVDILMLTASNPIKTGLTTRLGSEPADLAVNHGSDLAYISLMGADAVVEIDLAAFPMTELRRWESPDTSSGRDFQLKRPRFLNLDAISGFLYVAPNLSGNNTFTFRDRDAGGVDGTDGTDHDSGVDTDGIQSGYNNAKFPGDGLPDHDLFRIDVGLTGAGSGDVYPLARGAGSILTGHGLHSDGKYWMLGIDSLNTSAFTEPALNGNFAKNAVARLDASLFSTAQASGPSLPVSPAIDLDDNGLPAGLNYDTATSVPFPYAFATDGPGGVSAIGSSTLSRVVIYPTTGARHTINLGTDPVNHGGRVIRDLEFVAGDLFIYCQQSSNIIVVELNSSGIPTGSANRSLNLGGDPTPLAIAKGREIFYDATFSENHRFTCATCHPGGESDLLLWDLKDGVADFKDPMQTQPLKGLRETFPFHWRGERNLTDFNGAFTGLLGHSMALSGDDMAKFEDFLFSLRPAANPHANLARNMRTSFRPLGSPVAGTPGNTNTGQDEFALPSSGVGGPVGCFDCHPAPTGSVGMVNFDNRSGELRSVATSANLETVQLSNFLQAREQPLFDLEIKNIDNTIETQERSLLGTGFRHNAAERSLYGFIEQQFSQGSTPVFSTTAVEHVSAYLSALDTGTPPMAHAAVLWNRLLNGTDRSAILGEMESQAKDGWIDLVAFGRGPTSAGGTQVQSWVYDPVAQHFISDDPANTLTPNLTAMKDYTTHLGLSHTFVGTPRGLGHRLGVDYDDDGLINGEEASHSALAWQPDTDGDGDPDGYEVDNGTNPNLDTSTVSESVGPKFTVGGEPALISAVTKASSAIVQFETNEPTVWELVATPSAGSGAPPGAVTAKGVSYGTIHTAHVHGLHPSFDISGGLTANYDIQVKLKDLSNNPNVPTPADTVAVQTTSAQVNLPQAGIVVKELDYKIAPLVSSGTFVATAEITLEHWSPAVGAANDFVVLVEIQRRDDALDDWRPVPDSELIHLGANRDSGGNTVPITVDHAGDMTVVTGVEYGALVSATDVSGNAIGTVVATVPTALTAGVDGVTALRYGVTGVVGGNEIAMRILAIIPTPAGWDPTVSGQVGHLDSSGFATWNMPFTPVERRALIYVH